MGKLRRPMGKMSFIMRPFVGPGLSGCCSVVSVFGILILSVLGFAFYNNAEVLMGHREDPADGHAVAMACWGAAMLYAVFAVVCGCQLGAHTRQVRNQPGAVRL